MKKRIFKISLIIFIMFDLVISYLLSTNYYKKIEYIKSQYVIMESNLKITNNIRDEYIKAIKQINDLKLGLENTKVKNSELQIEIDKSRQRELELSSNLSSRSLSRENSRDIINSTDNSDWEKFTATAYCPCEICCGKTNGITAMGTKATEGRTVAMSSKYPFGTKIEIQGMGIYTVEDRGGAIKSNKIDIFMSSHKICLEFGRKIVYLKIIK